MRVIGTAGHVDHGKSTLVKRLTGIDPDRLAEEKAREMTIDLGFAWLTMPDGAAVGVVDVPGHRDFIENMLAGVGGIDAVLLVIAADEGVMPQTREHLAILDLLGLEHGLIVLTKIDTVDDPDWLALVEAEIRDIVSGTALANAEIVPVSAYTGAGIPLLLQKLEVLLNQLPARSDYGTPRLPIDRVFTMSGFGTVVTGTLLGGALRIGDEVELLPDERRGRVRGLQSYKQAVEIAYPGSRVAVNLAGVEKSAVKRGFTLARIGQLQPTTLIDVRFRHLKESTRPLKHNAEVKVFSGTSEVSGFVRLLDVEALAPGDEGWIQLRLVAPLVAAQGDRVILRIPSPAQTIGGGIVVDPHPARRWRRFQPSVLADLETRMRGTPEQRIAQAAEGIEPLKRTELQKRSGYSAAELDAAVNAALSKGLLIQPGNADAYLATTSFNRLLRSMREAVMQYHATNPLRMGIPREELRSRLNIKNATLTLLMETSEVQAEVIQEGNLLRHPDHSVTFTNVQQQRIAALLQAMNAAPYTPPSYQEAVGITGEDVLRALIDLGEIVQVQPDVIFTHQTYDELVATTLNLIDTHGAVSAKLLRDHFDTSRKYAIGLLEYLDTVGITRRVGDDRVRGKNAANSARREK